MVEQGISPHWVLLFETTLISSYNKFFSINGQQRLRQGITVKSSRLKNKTEKLKIYFSKPIRNSTILWIKGNVVTPTKESHTEIISMTKMIFTTFLFSDRSMLTCIFIFIWCSVTHHVTFSLDLVSGHHSELCMFSVIWQQLNLQEYKYIIVSKQWRSKKCIQVYKDFFVLFVCWHVDTLEQPLAPGEKNQGLISVRQKSFQTKNNFLLLTISVYSSKYIIYIDFQFNKSTWHTKLWSLSGLIWVSYSWTIIDTFAKLASYLSLSTELNRKLSKLTSLIIGVRKYAGKGVSRYQS